MTFVFFKGYTAYEMQIGQDSDIKFQNWLCKTLNAAVKKVDPKKRKFEAPICPHCGNQPKRPQDVKGWKLGTWEHNQSWGDAFSCLKCGGNYEVYAHVTFTTEKAQ